MRNFLTAAFLITCIAGVLSAGEKKLMHCFYFTPAKDVTEASWEAFYKATDALPGKISGLEHVWYGKLTRPATVISTDRETFQKLAGGGEKVTGPVNRIVREYGVCMEFADAAALKKYGDDPAHKAWEEVYFKVRQPGTNSYDFMGQ